MKRCPACGGIGADGSIVCDLCGSDLGGIEEEQLDVAVSETEKSQDASEKLLERRESLTIRRRAIRKLIAGLGLVIIGAGFFARGILVLEQRAGIRTGFGFGIDRLCDDRLRSTLRHNASIVLLPAN